MSLPYRDYEGHVLQRVGQLLRAVEDGDHINAICRHTIDQAIRVGDQFTEVSIIDHWHDAPGVRTIDVCWERRARLSTTPLA